MLGFIILMMFAVSIGGAAFVSGMVYNRLVKTGNKYPKTINTIVFIGSFAVIFLAILIILGNNFRIER